MIQLVQIDSSVGFPNNTAVLKFITSFKRKDFFSYDKGKKLKQFIILHCCFK